MKIFDKTASAFLIIILIIAAVSFVYFLFIAPEPERMRFFEIMSRS
jgi:hypothetical protein